MIRLILLQRLAQGLGVFLCVLSIIPILISCSSDDDGNKGWVTITEPSDSTSYTAENIDTIRISGKMFQSPSGGTKSGTECGCSNIAICFPPICYDYSYFVFALTVTVTNQSTGVSIEAGRADLSEPDGWSVEVPLVYGENLIEVYVEDLNGINAREEILIEVKDTIAATILSINPENNAINVATTTDVILTFSEPLEPSSIRTSSVSLSANGSEVEGSFTFDDDTNILVFSPNEPLLHNTNYTLSINSDITDLNGTGVIADTWHFTTIPMATIPAVQTEDATDVGETSATLWGSVSPNYADTEAWFEWGTDSNLSIFSTTEKVAIPLLSGDSKLSRRIGLNPSVDYYYRMVASNSAGTNKGEIQSFFTLAPPTAITSPPLILSPYQVKLSGSVNPNGYTTEASFKISSHPDIASRISSSPPIQLGDGRNFIGIDHEFDQLASGTKYYCRLEASYPRGTVFNNVLNFTTPYSTSSCWAKRYHPFKDYFDMSLFEEITSIDQTLDDGYIFIEWGVLREDGTGGQYPARVIKTNSDGGVEWAHRYCRSYTTSCPPILVIRQISTGGYIVSGFVTVSWSVLHHHENTWIAELDENGDTVWEKEYGVRSSSSTKEYHPTDIHLLPDGYIVSGTYNGTSAWMMKLDMTGNRIWSQSYSGGILNDVAQVPGGYVMASTTGYEYTQDRDVLVRMLDQDGTVQWANNYGTTDKDISKSMAVSAGTIAIIGTVIYADETSDIRVFGINTNGAVSWQYIFDGGYDDRASSIHSTSDGGFIVGANTDINESDKGVVLLKLSNSGILEWQTLYPDKIISNDQDTLTPVSGGDYIIGVRSIPSQETSIELIKTDSSGSCSPLDSPSFMMPVTSELTVTPSTISSGSGSPSEDWAISIDAVDWYVEIEQIHP